jgi:hypothetical protein
VLLDNVSQCEKSQFPLWNLRGPREFHGIPGGASTKFHARRAADSTEALVRVGSDREGQTMTVVETTNDSISYACAKLAYQALRPNRRAVLSG